MTLGLAPALIASACLFGQTGSSELRAKKKEIDRLVAPLVEAKAIPGFVIGLADRQGHEIFGYGRERDSQETPPGEDTVFEIGSVTKVFTALLLAEMADRNELKLDDPIELYLPTGVAAPEHGGKKITLLELATHTSGLPPMVPGWRPENPSNPYKELSLERLLKALSSFPLDRDPGQKYQFSSMGMGLLGELLALKAHKSYAALINERVLEPLGMRSTAVALDDAMKYRLTPAHEKDGGATPLWDVGALAGAAGLRSTAGDLLIFLRANMGIVRTPLISAIAVSHAERRAIEGGKVALGWHILDDGLTYWHNGQTGGHHAFVAFQTKSSIGAVVLANAAAPEIDAVGFAVMKILRGERVAPVDVEPRMRDETRPKEATAEPPKPAVDPAARRAVLDAWVEPFLRDDWTPGLVLATVEGKRVEFFKWGTESPLRPKPPDENTVFEIGSITKVFTAALLADMALRGEIRLEDQVLRYFPAGTRLPANGGKRITFADLALNRSGLPRVPANLIAHDPFDEYAGYSEDQLFEFLSGYTLPRAPGEKYELSNTGYALLGLAMARRTGRSFGSLLYERISKPLGLSHTAVSYEISGESHLAEGHDAPGISRPAWNFNASVFDAALGLHSTARELARFVRANFPHTQSPLKDALQRAQSIKKPRDGLGYSGLGWEVLADERTFYQSGKTGGHRSFVILDPDRRIGAVLLANASGTPLEGLGLAVLNLLRGERRDPPKLRQTKALDAATSDRIAGAYEIAREQLPEKVVIRKENGRLFLQREGMGEIPIYAESQRHLYGRGTDVEIDVVPGGLILHQEDHHDRATRK